MLASALRGLRWVSFLERCLSDAHRGRQSDVFFGAVGLDLVFLFVYLFLIKLTVFRRTEFLQLALTFFL